LAILRRYGSGARNTFSGEPNSFSNRADSREASPDADAGVSVSHERNASGSIVPSAYLQDNLVFK